MTYFRAYKILITAGLIVMIGLFCTKVFAGGSVLATNIFTDQTLRQAEHRYTIVRQDLEQCMEEYPGLPERCSGYAERFQRAKSDLGIEQQAQQARQADQKKIDQQDNQDPVIVQINQMSLSPQDKVKWIQRYKEQSSQKCMACP